jgi:hypothetical protein
LTRKAPITCPMTTTIPPAFAQLSPGDIVQFTARRDGLRRDTVVTAAVSGLTREGSLQLFGVSLGLLGRGLGQWDPSQMVDLKVIQTADQAVPANTGDRFQSGDCAMAAKKEGGHFPVHVVSAFEGYLVGHDLETGATITGRLEHFKSPAQAAAEDFLAAVHESRFHPVLGDTVATLKRIRPNLVEILATAHGEGGVHGRARMKATFLTMLVRESELHDVGNPSQAFFEAIFMA